MIGPWRFEGKLATSSLCVVSLRLIHSIVVKFSTLFSLLMEMLLGKSEFSFGLRIVCVSIFWLLGTGMRCGTRLQEGPACVLSQQLTSQGPGQEAGAGGICRVSLTGEGGSGERRKD